MQKVYYFKQPASLYKGISILGFLFACFLIFIHVMMYLQDGVGLSFIQYVQHHKIAVLSGATLVILFLLASWYLKRSIDGMYRVDITGLQYKNKRSHFLIKWDEIESIEFDGYGTLLLSGQSKRFMFSMLAIIYDKKITENGIENQFLDGQSLSALSQYMGITKASELSVNATEALKIISEKSASSQIVAKYNVYCGFKSNKNVSAKGEIF